MTGTAETSVVHPALLDLDEVQDRVREAVAAFLSGDGALLELNVGEPAVVACFRGYLEPRFAEWNVDAEYNRRGTAPKVLRRYRQLARSAGLDVPDREYPSTPDIVVHKRGSDTSNLLAIEVKRSSNTADRTRDHLKLQALREELGYAYSLFLEFGDGSDAGSITSEQWNVRREL